MKIEEAIWRLNASKITPIGVCTDISITDAFKWNEVIDMAIAALCTQQEADKNEPLTLDELRTMNGLPVWVVLDIDNMSPIRSYAIVDSELECVKGLACFLLFGDYGSWVAYRHQPKTI